MKCFFSKFLAVLLLTVLSVSSVLAEGTDVSLITTDDFIYSTDTDEWLHFLNQNPGSYQYFSLDKTGNIVPNDDDGGYTTNRGIHLLDSVDAVLTQYGDADFLPFDAASDTLYSALKSNNDKNRAILDSCIYYLVYTLDDTAQMLFFFDGNDQAVVVCYIYDTLYEDSLTELSKGSKGIWVKKLQKRLKNLGFYSKSIDGDYGKETVTAVEQFQQFNGLEVTGIASTDLQRLLYSNEAKGILNVGNKNSFVAQGKSLFPFLTLASQNGYSIGDAVRNGTYVFATAAKGDTEYPICYFVEDQKVYSVSIIERKQGDIKKSGYQDCVVAMAKSLNHEADEGAVLEALQTAINNPGIGVMLSTNDMQFIYESDEGMLTVSY